MSAPNPQPLPTPSRSGKLLRRSNSDRLRMHAPSSIQIVSPSPASEWKVAIPLLSPLDMDLDSWPADVDPTVEVAQEEKDVKKADSKWATWQHPASPFYYDPTAGKAPSFLLPA